jgi:predicted HTH domain antitoxin
MPTLTIPSEILQEAGINEHEAVVEFACHLFDAGKLSLWSAARLAGLDRAGIEEELTKRRIAIYRPSLEDVAQDLATLDRLRK